jgi:hypothetical protein
MVPAALAGAASIAALQAIARGWRLAKGIRASSCRCCGCPRERPSSVSLQKAAASSLVAATSWNIGGFMAARAFRALEASRADRAD